MFDIDGVLADTGIPVIKEVNREWGTSFKPDDVSDWTFTERVITKLTGDPSEGKRANAIWFDPEVLFRSPPRTGALEVLIRLEEQNWVSWSATSRLPNAREMTMEWLNMYFPDIFSGRVYMREPGNEKLISSEEIKLAAVGMLGAMLYAEDDPVSVKYVVENCPHNGLVVAMLDCGWNHGVNKKLEQLRVKDWGELGRKAKGIRSGH